MSVRTDLDLGTKISIKRLSVGLRLYEIEFLTNQATLRPLQNRSDLTWSYLSISISVLKTVFSSLVLCNPITVAFVSLAIFSISSILDRRLFIFKLMKCMSLF